MDKKYLVSISSGLIALVALVIALLGGDTETIIERHGTTTLIVDEFVNGVTIGDKTIQYKELTVGHASQYASWVNDKGKPVLVFLESLDLVSTTTQNRNDWKQVRATSTYQAFVGTSTSATLFGLNNYTAPNLTEAVLLNGWVIPTTTGRFPHASTTSSYLFVGNSGNQRPSVWVQPDDRITFKLQASAGNDASHCTSPAGGPVIQLCSSATSTDRGFDLKGVLRLEY